MKFREPNWSDDQTACCKLLTVSTEAREQLLKWF